MPEPTKTRELIDLSIAGVRLRLLVREGLLDSPFAFFREASPSGPGAPAPDFFLDILEQVRFPAPEPPDPGLPPGRVRRDGNTVTIRAPYFEGALDLAGRSGTCRQSPRSPGFRACVQVVLSVLAAPRGTLFLHGAALEKDGAAHLFCGPSGAGKSTVAKLAGLPVLNDELCAVSVRAPGGPALAGTPLGLCETTASLPLRAIFWLEQSPDDAIDPLPPPSALPLVLSQTVSGAGDPAHINLLFQLVAELLERVPVYRLRFTRSQKFLQWLDEGGGPG